MPSKRIYFGAVGKIALALPDGAEGTIRGRGSWLVAAGRPAKENHLKSRNIRPDWGHSS
jgi:hypothetical protein